MLALGSRQQAVTGGMAASAAIRPVVDSERPRLCPGCLTRAAATSILPTAAALAKRASAHDRIRLRPAGPPHGCFGDPAIAGRNAARSRLASEFVALGQSAAVPQIPPSGHSG